MESRSISSRDFAGVAANLLQSGHAVRFRAGGSSMTPFVRDGDILTVMPVGNTRLRRGDIVLYRRADGRVIAHRILGQEIGHGRPILKIRGDARTGNPESVPADQILGYVARVQRGNSNAIVPPGRRRIPALLWARTGPATRRLAQWLRRIALAPIR